MHLKWKEKAALLEAIFGVRLETESDKRQMVYKVEQLMKNDNLNKQELAELGLGEIDEKEDTYDCPCAFWEYDEC